MIEEAVKTISGTHPGLSALIGSGASNAFYWGEAPQGAALPYVVAEKDGGFRPIAGVYTNTGWGYSRIQFEAHAATKKEAKALMLQVRAAFDRYQGTVGGVQIDAVGTLWQEDGGEGYDYDLDHYVVDEMCEFFHTE